MDTRLGHALRTAFQHAHPALRFYLVWEKWHATSRPCERQCHPHTNRIPPSQRYTNPGTRHTGRRYTNLHPLSHPTYRLSDLAHGVPYAANHLSNPDANGKRYECPTANRHTRRHRGTAYGNGNRNGNRRSSYSHFTAPDIHARAYGDFAAPHCHGNAPLADCAPHKPIPHTNADRHAEGMAVRVVG